MLFPIINALRLQSNSFVLNIPNYKNFFYPVINFRLVRFNMAWTDFVAGNI